MTHTSYTVPAPRRTRRPSEAVRQDERLTRRIRAALTRNPCAVVKALEILQERQTRDERRDAVTRHENFVGFRQDHAKRGAFLTSLITEGRKAGLREDCLLRGEALEMGRTITLRYAATQLLSLAKAHEAAVAYEAAIEAQERAWALQDAADNAGTLGEHA
jgi:hypothetical protein